jgi:hypothetical protein
MEDEIRDKALRSINHIFSSLIDKYLENKNLL